MMAPSKCSRDEDELDPLDLPVSPRPPPPGTALSFQHARTPHNSSHPDVTHTTRVHLFAGAVGVVIDGSYWDLGGQVSVEEGATLAMTKTAILRVNSIFVGVSERSATNTPTPQRTAHACSRLCNLRRGKSHAAPPALSLQTTPLLCEAAAL